MKIAHRVAPGLPQTLVTPYRRDWMFSATVFEIEGRGQPSSLSAEKRRKEA